MAKRTGRPEDLHQHGPGHRRATTWLAEGEDVVEAEQVLGHERPRYPHIRGDPA